MARSSGQVQGGPADSSHLATGSGEGAGGGAGGWVGLCQNPRPDPGFFVSMNRCGVGRPSERCVRHIRTQRRGMGPRGGLPAGIRIQSPKKTYLGRCPAEGIRGAWNWRRVLCPGGKTPPTWWESQLEKSSSWRPGHCPLFCGHRDNACVESRLLCTCLRERRKSVADPVLEAKPCPGVAITAAGVALRATVLHPWEA